MRYLAPITGRNEAESFVAYMVTKSISVQIEGTSENPEVWDVWVRDEDHMQQAREELNRFLENPHAPQYQAAVGEAQRIIKEKQQAARTAAQNIRKVQHRTAGPMNPLGRGRIPPLTLTLLLLSIAVSLLSNFGNVGADNTFSSRVFNQLRFVTPQALKNSGGDPAASLKQGQVWRAVTPIFLHGSPLHLALNMLMLVMLGRLAENVLGTVRYALLIFYLALIPNLLAGLVPPDLGGWPNFVGISGVVYGLTTFLWIVFQNRPELGYRIPGNLIVLLVVMIVVGFAGLIPGLSNWSHLGGFVAGMAAGLIVSSR